LSQPSVLQDIRMAPGAAERGGQWSDVLRDAHFGDSIRPLDGPDRFGGRLVKRQLDDCVVASLSTSPFRANFKPGSAAADYLVLYELDSDAQEWALLTDGQRVDGSARVVILDNASLASAGQRAAFTGTYLFLPKDTLRARGFQLAQGGRPLALDSLPYAGLLMDLARALLQPRKIEAAEVLAIRAAILDLVCGMRLRAEPETSVAVSESMRRRVEAWVRDNLARGPVTPASTAKAHGISVRSLHRLFDGSESTFSTFVRSARLDQARLTLASTDLTVQDIAARWGFSDVSHFCREFKRQFGVTTSDFRSGLDELGRQHLLHAAVA
jgi:AraC family transcriptional activator of tynA and feaB